MVSLTVEGKIALTVAVIVVIALIAFSKQIFTAIRSQFVGEKPGSTGRGSDQVAPAGTAQYLTDLSAAAPEAPAEFILTQAMSGATIASCQKDWIRELIRKRSAPLLVQKEAT